MNKILITLFLLLVSYTVQAQEKFALGYSNFRSAETSKEYVVHHFEGQTASQLQAATYSALTSMYTSPKDAISTIGTGIISAEIYLSTVFYSDGNYPHDYLIIMTIEFKDGKVKYNAPSIKDIVMRNIPFLGTGNIDKIKLWSVSNEHKAQVERAINGIISAIDKKISEADDW